MTARRVADFELASIDELVRMWRASFEHGVGITDHHPIGEQIAYLREQVLPAYRLRVTLEGQAIVGFLASNPESVAQLFVRVDRFGQGIGTQLLNLAKSESSGSLWLFTYQRNTRACRFYEHQGFVAIARGFEPFWQLADVKYRWVRADSEAGGRPDRGLEDSPAEGS
jgi:GNAT superfamily N-acetyltransferase